jgi:hypothetical protein
VLPEADEHAATLSLARVESLRLLRHPAVLVATALVLLIWVISARSESGRFPVLFYSAFEIQLQLVPLAVGAMLGGNLAMLRSYRHGAEVFYGVAPLPAWRRTLAHLLSVLSLAAVVGLVAVARIVQLAAESGAVGRPDPRELAVAPVLVAFFGALGVLLARLTRSTAIVPLLLAFVTLSWMFGALSPIPSGARWLSPLPPSGFAGVDQPQPSNLLDRPAGPHLIYLIALVIVLGSVAILSAGAPRLPVVATTAVALLVSGVTAGMQVGGPSGDVVARRTAAMNAPAATQRCEHRDAVTYCAFPDFLPRVKQWDRVVTDVRRQVPAQLANQPFVVRQRVLTASGVTVIGGGALVEMYAVNHDWAADDERAGTPNSVPIGTNWGAPRDETAFAARVAHRLITGSEVTGDSDLPSGWPDRALPAPLTTWTSRSRTCPPGRWTSTRSAWDRVSWWACGRPTSPSPYSAGRPIRSPGSCGARGRS